MRKGIHTYQFENDQYVKLDDVLKIASEMKLRIATSTDKDFKKRPEKERSAALLALVKMQFRLVGMDDEQDEMPSIPARYAVGKCYDEEKGYHMFYVGTEDSKPIFTNRPCKAKGYKRRRDAEAVADFLDDGDWEVFDMWDSMSEEQKTMRKCFCNPEEDDEGNDPITRLTFEEK